MLILRDADLKAVLTVEETIDALKVMLADQAAGGITMPDKVTADITTGGFLRVMPSLHERSGYMGFKFMDVVPKHGARYAIALLDVATGALEALVDADYITMMRTSATAALATDLIGPAEVEEMGLIGSSTQAEGLILALAAVRKLPRVKVFSPNAERRQAFADRMKAETGIDVVAVASADDAIQSANVICGAYRASGTPSISAASLRPGVHLNSLSSVRAQAREVTDDVWAACAQIIVDHRVGVAASGDGISIRKTDGKALESAPELWEALRDGVKRKAPDAVTMFKSVGAATQDLAVAARAVELARRQGMGQDVGEFPVLRKHN
jgi:alanine dehydrogenase